MANDKQEEAAAGQSLVGGRVSRRDLVRLAGAGAAVAAAGMTATQAHAAKPGRWDREADVVVVGTGAAGFTAALIAHEAGRSVILLEKMPEVGGTTGISGGVYWIPNNALMRAEGIADARADCLRYMARTAYPTIYNPADPRLGLTADEYALLEATYDEGDNAVTALGKMGALRSTLRKLRDVPYPDYYPLIEENKAPRGRGLLPLTPDGKDVPPAGVGRLPLAGAEMIRQLKAAADGRKIPILVNHRAERLVTNARGEIIGLEARTGKRKIRIRAGRGVIFGSGGFIQNQKMCEQHLRGPVFGGGASRGAEGDFIGIAGRVGAQLGNMPHAWWGQVILEEALQDRFVGNMIWGIPGSSTILVNAYGRRCGNEHGGYDERTQSHFHWDLGRVGYSNAIQFAVYDEASRQKSQATRGVVVKAGVNAPHVLTGATVEDLAQAIQQRLVQLSDRTGGYRIDPDFAQNLKQTIERFNGFARTGVDLDFRRGQSWTGSAWVKGENVVNSERVSPTDPNPSMAPMSTSGPYYAVMIGAGALDTKGGPKVNARAQVVNQDNKPIPGLYGAGNCVGSPAGQGYWAGGGTIGPAMTFGYLAGLNVAAESVKSEA